MSTTTGKIFYWGRWVALLPASLAGAWVAFLVARLINSYTAAPFLNPDSFMFQLLLETMGHLALGAAFVYTGVYVAPSHRRVTAYVMAGLSIIAGGIMLYAAMISPIINSWAIYGGSLFLVAALVTTNSVLHDCGLISHEIRADL